jgi:Xaa-Pro dipeptidase
VAMREHRVDAVLAGSPGLVAFLTGHVVPAHLAYPSRDARLEKPTVALVTQDGVVTIGSDPRPAHGDAVRYGDGALGLHDGPEAFEALRAAAAELGTGAGRMGVELALVPAGALAAVRDGSPKLEVVPLDDALERAKTTKSADEVAGIAEAVALTDAGHDAIRAAAVEGVMEVQLYAEAVRAMNERAGSLVIPLCELQVGPRAENFFENAAPTRARLEAGELVMADIAPRHPNGWWADSCSTVACGEVAPDVREEWVGLRDGLEAGRELLRPGVRAGEVFDAVERHAGEQLAYVGHGIGRDHLEGPKLAPGSTEPIPEGAVIVIEPGRYGNGRGMRIEHAFRVTPDGGEPLSEFSLEL